MPVLRTPLLVVVFPFRVSSWSGVEYCLLRGTGTDGHWQGIAGGGDGSASPGGTARQVLRDAAGVAPDAPLYPLQSMDTVPVTSLREPGDWPGDLYAVPRYTFAVDVGDQGFGPVDGYPDCAWADYPTAYGSLRHQLYQHALWELHERIYRHHLVHPAPVGG